MPVAAVVRGEVRVEKDGLDNSNYDYMVQSGSANV